ncbi:hypothetical protein [Rhizobium sp. 2MFCol3.1]|jgi:hypothetical protein|uniref:hypothetical protein n=1 Tax=Rhizobium sp. 2MFCol3.1 TaxID=1246459 RepID=UPI000379900E|nr:hypothetical protein [Rhizobium sp. 2MFCol3.1]
MSDKPSVSASDLSNARVRKFLDDRLNGPTISSREMKVRVEALIERRRESLLTAPDQELDSKPNDGHKGGL